MSVNADTITEFQILTVQRALTGVPHKNAHHRAILQDCGAALRGSRACRESVARTYNQMLGASPAAGNLTADTVTDMQIVDLLSALLNDAHAHVHRHGDIRMCKVAIGHIRKGKQERAAARARCAEILNEQAKERCPGRQHDQHVGDVCKGQCCTSCGGSVDENEECRCG